MGLDAGLSSAKCRNRSEVKDPPVPAAAALRFDGVNAGGRQGLMVNIKIYRGITDFPAKALTVDNGPIEAYGPCRELACLIKTSPLNEFAESCGGYDFLPRSSRFNHERLEIIGASQGFKTVHCPFRSMTEAVIRSYEDLPDLELPHKDIPDKRRWLNSRETFRKAKDNTVVQS